MYRLTFCCYHTLEP
uniref:Uncharacterized protein n=1 Tax=Arundo donax TaxID=35708 RepID=A0A0A9HAR4_ARUDO